MACPENIKTEESKWNWSILEKMKSIAEKNLKLSSVAIFSLTEFEAELKGFRKDMDNPNADLDWPLQTDGTTSWTELPGIG